jgi:hypothetical protein
MMLATQGLQAQKTAAGMIGGKNVMQRATGAATTKRATKFQ